MKINLHTSPIMINKITQYVGLNFLSFNTNSLEPTNQNSTIVPKRIYPTNKLTLGNSIFSNQMSFLSLDFWGNLWIFFTQKDKISILLGPNTPKPINVLFRRFQNSTRFFYYIFLILKICQLYANLFQSFSKLANALARSFHAFNKHTFSLNAWIAHISCQLTCT